MDEQEPLLIQRESHTPQYAKLLLALTVGDLLLSLIMYISYVALNLDALCPPVTFESIMIPLDMLLLAGVRTSLLFAFLSGSTFLIKIRLPVWSTFVRI